MNSPVTIDASVFVSAFTPTEPAHQASKSFMLMVREQSIPIIVPVLVLPEISAALSRGQGKPKLGKAFVQELRNFPNTTFIDVDENAAILAADIPQQTTVCAAVTQSMRRWLCGLEQNW